MHVASLSKMITAVLMTKVLDDHKISYDTPISGYLPAYWKPLGRNVDTITFRELLTQKSGFVTHSTGSSDFLFMKDKVLDGVDPAAIGTYKYENMNFGLCRILIAVIMGAIDRDTIFSESNDAMWDFVTIFAYARYSAQYVFDPSGVNDAILSHPADGVLGYDFPTDGHGWNSGDLTSQAGGAGWHLTVNDMLNVMGTVRRAGTILSKDKAQDMLEARFGIDGVQTTPLGKTYCKDGFFANKFKTTVDQKAEQGFACYLPQDIELVVLANSPRAAGSKALGGHGGQYIPEAHRPEARRGLAGGLFVPK
jgi:CubicO group peptidase (beta-lactamase class C family)